jgi:hypothetical protein
MKKSNLVSEGSVWKQFHSSFASKLPFVLTNLYQEATLLKLGNDLIFISTYGSSLWLLFLNFCLVSSLKLFLPGQGK